jgi:hypothetical protein
MLSEKGLKNGKLSHVGARSSRGKKEIPPPPEESPTPLNEKSVKKKGVSPFYGHYNGPLGIFEDSCHQDCEQD